PRRATRAPAVCCWAPNALRPRRALRTKEKERSLDEAAVDCRLTREDQPPPVARQDGPAWQHATRGHRDDPYSHAPHHHEVPAPDHFHVVERDALRAVDHAPYSLSGSEGREGVVSAARCCARGSRARAYQGVGQTL